MNHQERKIQVYKMRINSLIEEHADALAQAQEFHQNLQDAENKIIELEKIIKEKNVQEEKPRHTIIDMDAQHN